MNLDPNFREVQPSLTNGARSAEVKDVKSKYIIKDGRKYQVEVQTIHHDLAWKVWQGVQAFFLTFFSLGVGFAFQGFRDTWKQKWEQSVTGDEKRFIYIRDSPKNVQTDKTARFGTLLQSTDKPPTVEQKQPTVNQPLVELPLEVHNFIKEAREDITKISIDNLEKGLKEALKFAADIKNPEDITTIFTIAERIASSYVVSNFAKALEVRIQVAQKIQPSGPLANLQVALQNEHPKLGVKLYPVDTSLFKNHSLGVQTRKFTDGTTQLHLNAKLSHPIRQKLQDSIEAIKAHPKSLFDALPNGFCNSVNVSTETIAYEGRTDKMGKWDGDFSHDIKAHGFKVFAQYPITSLCASQVIKFEGVGKVTIATSDFHAEHNRISIDLDPSISVENAPEKLNIIFAALGLGTVSSSFRTEDNERIKVMQLFRAFYPKEAYDFERESISFEESVESLKTRIANKVPDMKAKFKDYLVDHPEKMYQQEVYPGQPVWCVKGLSDDVRKAGGIGLMTGVTANNFDDAIKRLMSMLKGGALSSQDRFELGIMAKGDSSGADLQSGGGDSVFVRMITEGMPKNFNDYPLNGKMQILYDLDLVERVGYVYSEDKFGTKDPSDYRERPTVTKLVENIEIKPNEYMGNEICIHHRIGSEFIKGIRVNNDSEKAILIEALKKEPNLVTQNNLKQDCFNGIPLDQFIRVGDVKKEYWA